MGSPPCSRSNRAVFGPGLPYKDFDFIEDLLLKLPFETECAADVCHCDKTCGVWESGTGLEQHLRSPRDQ